MMPRVCAIALLGAIIIKTLSEMGLRSISSVKTLILALILSFSVEPITELIGLIGMVALKEEVTEGVSVMAKSIGLGYVFGFSADICSSLGEGEVAAGVLTVGRLQIFLLALPYLTKIISLGLELFE